MSCTGDGRREDRRASEESQGKAKVVTIVQAGQKLANSADGVETSRNAPGVDHPPIYLSPGPAELVPKLQPVRQVVEEP
jgi:hypothetical protein